jgi:hypothetical protein
LTEVEEPSGGAYGVAASVERSGAAMRRRSERRSAAEAAAAAGGGGMAAWAGAKESTLDPACLRTELKESYPSPTSGSGAKQRRSRRHQRRSRHAAHRHDRALDCPLLDLPTPADRILPIASVPAAHLVSPPPPPLGVLPTLSCLHLPLSQLAINSFEFWRRDWKSVSSHQCRSLNKISVWWGWGGGEAKNLHEIYSFDSPNIQYKNAEICSSILRNLCS